MRICGLRISVGEPRAERPGAWNGVAAEVEPAVRRGGLHGTDTARVRPEQVDLRVVPAVVRPHDEIATGDREIDAIAEHASHRRQVQGVAGRELTQLDERSVL